MQSIIDGLIRWLKLLFKPSLWRYRRRLESRVRAKTVGKVQAKVHQTRSNVDRKVFAAQDRALGDKPKK